MASSVLVLSNVSIQVPGRVLLEDVCFTLPTGASLAITGRSGSGKTTLMRCIAGLSRSFSGAIELGGRELRTTSRRELDRIRLNDIGLVHQSGDLLDELTTLENVTLPARLAGASRSEATADAIGLLRALSVDTLADAQPHTLSGGERQRVAVARALMNKPSVVLADEPTGALDEDNARDVADLLFRVCREWDTSLLVATHDAGLADRADRAMTVSHYRLTPALDAAR